ncbi:MAG: PIG-L family deacetylase [Verrucomicrobiota bacterium]
MPFPSPPCRPLGALLVLLILQALLPAALGQTIAGETGSGAERLKVDLLGIFAHPDDETGVAATIARLALGSGRTVAHVYCTRGEGGGNMVGTQSGPALGLLREIELRDALRQLGVRQVHFLDKADFAYTESLSVTLERWGHEDTLGRMVRVIRALRPEVMVTMNPAPSPGQHGNHQAAGWLATEAFEAAADPGRFADQLRIEGLSPWRPRKLFYAGGSGNLGLSLPVPLTSPLPDGRLPVAVAGEALSNHRSQAFGSIARSPWFRRTTNQWFTPVLSVLPVRPSDADLFEGLPVEGACPPRWEGFPPTGMAEDPDLHVVPRPAVARFREFVRTHRIGHAVPTFQADLPVVAGRTTSLSLVRNAALAREEVRLEVPPGWMARWARDRQGGRIDVTAPAGAREDASLVATVAAHRATVRLHPVPWLRVPRVAAPPWNSRDDDPAWMALPVTAIGPELSWQGQADDASDCSAGFRVAHDGRHLWVEVRVRDNRVVSNIEPDDIKGHWRSDSIELCLDPAAGAEHTLGCWKAGIFPFDRTGRVRGARDADADPGPLERHSPGTRLLSWRTADGYAIRAAIPLAETGLKGRRGTLAGFNVLVYDGDQADARPGENINRTRLAWSPRPGVQGRPEDWGRIELQ